MDTNKHGVYKMEKTTKNNVYSADKVADWFLSKKPVSPKKLQKLVYYAYAWTLTILNDDKDHLNIRLFNDNIEAWVHGPVVPSLYAKYSNYGFNDIDVTITEVPKFQDDIEDVLNQVYEVYGDFNGNELESLTHQESPWQNARQDLSPLDASHNRISDTDIFTCYIQRVQN